MLPMDFLHLFSVSHLLHPELPSSDGLMGVFEVPSGLVGGVGAGVAWECDGVKIYTYKKSNMDQNNPRYKLKAYNLRQVRKALEFQKNKSTWDLYKEREFLETIVNQRINFIFTIFAVFITAATTVDNKINMALVFAIGAIVLFFLTRTTERVYIRLDIVAKMLYKAESNHVMPFVQKEFNALNNKPSGSELKNIYYRTPMLCAWIMVAGLVATILGWIVPGE